MFLCALFRALFEVSAPALSRHLSAGLELATPPLAASVNPGIMCVSCVRSAWQTGDRRSSLCAVAFIACSRSVGGVGVGPRVADPAPLLPSLQSTNSTMSSIGLSQSKLVSGFPVETIDDVIDVRQSNRAEYRYAVVALSQLTSVSS